MYFLVRLYKNVLSMVQNKREVSFLLPESIMETCAVLTFQSVDDHSNETSSTELLHGTIIFLIFYKMKFWIYLEF